MSQLKFGMFVRELDRPWLELPFKFQGFYIRSVDDIEKLKRYCDHVFIDLNKSKHVISTSSVATAAKKDKDTSIEHEKLWLPESQLFKDVDYQDNVSVEDELIPAQDARTTAIEVVEALYNDIRSGSAINIASTRSAVIYLVDSIIRNPDVHALMALLDECDKNRITHSLNVCTLVLTFGRQFGFPRQCMIELGLGALLHDVGQTKVPIEIVTKKGALTDDEYEIMKTHTTHGAELLRDKSYHLPLRAIDIVYSHHERYDGHGYPQGLKGKSIPLYARMVAIADFYEAITSQYADKEKLTPGTAMTALYAMRETDFDSKLVEEFIKCIGVYPIGCTVRLSTGEIGIVIAQNRQARLEPQLMLILDEDEKFYPIPRFFDIEQFKKTMDLKVVGIVASEDYDIDIKHYVGTIVRNDGTY